LAFPGAPSLALISSLTGIGASNVLGLHRFSVDDLTGLQLAGCGRLTVEQTPSKRNPYHVTLLGLPEQDPMQYPDPARLASIEFLDRMRPPLITLD
jgi:hypothetical protein